MLSSLALTSIRRVSRLVATPSGRAAAPNVLMHTNAAQSTPRFFSNGPFAVDAPDGEHDLQDVVSYLHSIMFLACTAWKVFLQIRHVCLEHHIGRIISMGQTSDWCGVHSGRCRFHHGNASCRFWEANVCSGWAGWGTWFGRYGEFYTRVISVCHFFHCTWRVLTVLIHIIHQYSIIIQEEHLADVNRIINSASVLEDPQEIKKMQGMKEEIRMRTLEQTFMNAKY